MGEWGGVNDPFLHTRVCVCVSDLILHFVNGGISRLIPFFFFLPSQHEKLLSP